jgi:iron(III) transport system ATP-binding protein
MKQGVVQQIDTPLNVYTTPANKFVFSFIGLSNCLAVEGAAGVFITCDGACPLPEGAVPTPAPAAGHFSLAARPSEIDFVDEGGLAGTVTRKAFLGESLDYQVQVGGQSLRIRKGRYSPGPDLGEVCRIRFLRPLWYPEE